LLAYGSVLKRLPRVRARRIAVGVDEQIVAVGTVEEISMVAAEAPVVIMEEVAGLPRRRRQPLRSLMASGRLILIP
jgi:hypothetical protein